MEELRPRALVLRFTSIYSKAGEMDRDLNYVIGFASLEAAEAESAEAGAGTCCFSFSHAVYSGSPLRSYFSLKRSCKSCFIQLFF